MALNQTLATGKWKTLNTEDVEIVTQCPVDDKKLYSILEKNLKRLQRMGKVVQKNPTLDVQHDLLPAEVDIPENLMYIIDISNKVVIDAVSGEIARQKGWLLDFFKLKSAKLLNKEGIIYLQAVYEAKRV